MADSGMDEFAQTRGADDLFDDEIIPVSAEDQQVQTEVVVPEEVAPAPQVQVQEESPRVEKTASPRGESAQRGRGGERGRGRGRGRGKGGRGGRESQPTEQKRAESVPRKNGSAKSGLEGSRWATVEESSEKPQAVEKDKEQEQTKEKDQPAEEEESKTEVASSDGTESARVPAVRGDRSATGGVRKVSMLWDNSLRTTSLTVTFLAETHRRGAFQAYRYSQGECRQEGSRSCSSTG